MLELKGAFKRLVQFLNFIWNNSASEILGLAQGHNKWWHSWNSFVHLNKRLLSIYYVSSTMKGSRGIKMVRLNPSGEGGGRWREADKRIQCSVEASQETRVQDAMKMKEQILDTLGITWDFVRHAEFIQGRNLELDIPSKADHVSQWQKIGEIMCHTGNEAVGCMTSGTSREQQ